MNANDKKIPSALIWVVGIAMIAFFATGTAAIVGWIPSSLGQSDASARVEQQNTAQAVKGNTTTVHTKAPVQRATPVAVAAAACQDCGVVQSVRAVQVKGAGTGLGGVGGGLVGGVLGHQIGGGSGKDLATVLGAVGGAVAGNEIEKQARASTVYDVTVRLNNGSTRVIRETHLPSWQSGDRVRVLDGTIQSVA